MTGKRKGKGSGKTRAAARGKKPSKGKTEKFIPEFMRARSEASRKGWEKRWERGTAPIGEKGRVFIERTFGPVIEGDLLQRRWHEEKYYDETEDSDYWDFYEVEY